MAGYDKLTPEGEKFYAEIAKLCENEVFVGFQVGHDFEKDEKTGGTVDMVAVAISNELGSSTIPPRPFLRMTVDENQDLINEMCEQAVRKIAKGASADKCLKEIGANAVSLVQEKIGNGAFEPNAEFTIKAKGSSHPLIDTGHMRQSVHYVIKRRGS